MVVVMSRGFVCILWGGSQTPRKLIFRKANLTFTLFLVSKEHRYSTMEYYSSLDASQLDSETPTLFELISSNQLEALLSPSLRYVLVHYTAKYPKYLLRIANRFDEINLSLRALVEWYFLHYWLGLFTENFYGLKRVSQTRLAGGRAAD